jgi:hypothetical protein
MVVSEQTAKATMWCPMARVRWQARPLAFNRSNPGAKERVKNWFYRTFFPNWHFWFRANYFRCSGSGCMMWRWQDGRRKFGYCGLAGSPAMGDFAGGDNLVVDQEALTRSKQRR